jgi:hypothetical protein
MGFIGKAWRGEERLWRVHWIYGALVGIIWRIIFAFAKGAPPPVVLVIFVPYFIYFVWFLVSEWRCAFNVDWKGWAYVVRFLVLLAPLALVGGLVVGFQKGFHDAQCRVVLNHPETRASHPGVFERCNAEGFYTTSNPPSYGAAPGNSSMPSAPVKP